MIKPKSSGQREFSSLPLDEQIVEIFYKRSSELIKPAFYAINDAYPLAERNKNPKANYKYSEAYNQAKYHRNFHKNIVRDSIVPLAIVKKHLKPFTVDGPTKDFRCLIENQFRMLHKRLIDYADLLVPETHMETFLTTLGKVYDTEMHTLLYSAPPEGLAHYQAISRYTNPGGF